MPETADTRWTPEVLAEMVQWLEQAYPREGCGLIVEDDDGRWTFQACENVIDKYHELDPQAYPRTSRDFYMIDPQAFLEVEKGDGQLAVIVHSHPDTGDYFSDADVQAALMPREGEDGPVEALHPGVDYLVVSVCDGRAQSASLYRLDEQRGEFDRVERLGSEPLREGVKDKAPAAEST